MTKKTHTQDVVRDARVYRKVICFFQSGLKYKSRYSIFSFRDAANLDEGDMLPTAFALKELTPAVKAKVAALVKKAVSVD